MTRAERKAGRRDLAAWCRDHGVMPTGQAWAAAVDGCRNVGELVKLNHADGHAAKRLPDGAMLPGGVRSGDFLPDHGGIVAAAPVTDPETGDVWVTVRGEDGTMTDHPMPATVPLTAIRPRTAPAWLQDAAAAYRDARDAWQAQRESGRPVDGRVTGASGAAVAFYQLEDDEYRRLYPAPRFTDYVSEYAARLREPAA